MKTTHSIFLLFIAVAITACATTIPAVDNERPNFKLSFIDQNGQTIQTFDEEDVLSAITMNLQEEQRYHVTYFANDQGGLKTASFTYEDAMNVIPPTPSPGAPPSSWIELPPISENTTFRYNGDRSNPKDEAGYSIKFDARGMGNRYTISFSAEDYGGASGIGSRGNRREGSINIVYSSRPSGVE